MKKTYILTITALVVIFVPVIWPAIVIATSSVGRPVLPIRAPRSIQERIRADIKFKSANIKNNQEIRNDLLSSTTIRHEIETKLINRQVRRGAFEIQKNHLVDQLSNALTNLKQVRTRITARITKDVQNGRDMTEANALLVTADAKITAAATAINNVKVLIDSTQGSATSSYVELNKPRQAGADAIKAVNEARNALNKVVVAIAHAMGMKVGQNGIIATSTATSTDSTN